MARVPGQLHPALTALAQVSRLCPLWRGVAWCGVAGWGSGQETVTAYWDTGEQFGAVLELLCEPCSIHLSLP